MAAPVVAAYNYGPAPAPVSAYNYGAPVSAYNYGVPAAAYNYGAVSAFTNYPGYYAASPLANFGYTAAPALAY